MNDTPEYIKELQLKNWLLKTPEERLRQFLLDNENLFLFWQTGKKQIGTKGQSKPEQIPKNVL